jgi:Fe-S oxidoreductase
MLGDTVFDLLKDLKNTWDPHHIFNPGKIIDTPSIRQNLRYKLGETRNIDTVFDFTEKHGIVRAAESCNGSGDCRKLHTAGGTMCPSYMATRDEQHSTRGRANVLREFLTTSQKENPFNHQEIYDALDLCLSCKACKSECPSSVDVAKMKAEFLQHWYDANGIPLRTKAIANITKLNRIGSLAPAIANFFLRNRVTSRIIKNVLGFAQERSLPVLQKYTVDNWAKSRTSFAENRPLRKRVVLFIDEFTNYNDSHIGVVTIRLLMRLGYHVELVKHAESGRTYLSKGLLHEAKKIAIKNVNALKDIITEEKLLIGIEPSAILTFRDEYPDLVGDELREQAIALAKNTRLIDEFIANEFDEMAISRDRFINDAKEVLLHGHCQQKALSSTQYTLKMLSIPENYNAKEIPSGCCGMAGSFGYEKEHYKISMQIGELVLFPAVRKAKTETIIVAPGTSCRHQIKDGTGKSAMHPVEVLFAALKSDQEKKMPWTV